jgi:hypothetical protein
MAQANMGTMTVTTEVPAVYLTLTIQEAQALALLLRYVGGNPDTTARKYTDNISMALNKAAVPEAIIAGPILDSRLGGTFYFSEDTGTL